MKLLPMFFSLVASTACGTFAVTSWALEGVAPPPAGLHAPVGGHGAAADVQQPGPQPQVLDAVASDGAGHVGVNRLAADGSDRVGMNRFASDGADHVGANRYAADGADYVGTRKRVADGSYRSDLVRVADSGYPEFDQPVTSYFCGPCR